MLKAQNIDLNDFPRTLKDPKISQKIIFHEFSTQKEEKLSIKVISKENPTVKKTLN